MPMPLPYPKAPEAPKSMGYPSQRMPKFKKLFEGPQGVKLPNANYAQNVPPELLLNPEDRTPFSQRSSYIRFLKGEGEGLPQQLLQVLQGGGRALQPYRQELLRTIVKQWIGS